MFLYLVCVASVAALLSLSFFRLYVVPAPVKHSPANIDVFSEERARQFLRQLEAIGPKYSGTGVTEIQTPAFLLSEIAEVVASSGWEFVSGLSSPSALYSPPQEVFETFRQNRWRERVSGVKGGEEGEEAGQLGCTCPRREFEDALDLSDFVQRSRDVLRFCWHTQEGRVSKADPVLLKALARLRVSLRISKTCASVQDWLLIDTFLRYLKSGYQLDVSQYLDTPTVTAQQAVVVSKLLLQDRHSSHFMGPILTQSGRKECTSLAALQACKSAPSAEAYPVDRFLIRRHLAAEQKEELIQLEVSLSHDYSGYFDPKVPGMGDIANIYLNVTNLAVRFLPFRLILGQESEEAIRHFTTAYKDLHSYDYNDVKSLLADPHNFDAQTLPPLTPLSTLVFPNIPPNLMLAAHYDTAVASPGGADAGACVAIVMETVRNQLAYRSTSVYSSLADSHRPLLLLFNGAEEMILPAADGFVKRHPWAPMTAEAINLEAAGNWGREYLLRSGQASHNLLEAYKRAVPHPHGFVDSQAAFEAGIVPALTDFQIFRDDGLMDGFDFALGSGGYFYHTPEDRMENIQAGSIQHYGETVSLLVRDLLSHPLEKVVPGTPAYFDFFGLWFILLPHSLIFSPLLFLAIGILWYGVTCFESKALIRLQAGRSGAENDRNRNLEDLSAWKPSETCEGLLLLLGLVVFVAAAEILASCTVVYVLRLPLRWFASPPLASVLYGPIAVVATLEYIVAAAKYSRWRRWPKDIKRSWENAVLEVSLTRSAVAIFFLFYLVSLYAGFRMIYIPIIWLVGTLAGRAIGLATSLYATSPTWIFPTAGTIVGNLMAFSILIHPYTSLVDHLVPAFGRAAGPIAPDIFLALLSGLYLTALPLASWMSATIFSVLQPHTAKQGTLSALRKTLYWGLLPAAVAIGLMQDAFTTVAFQRVDLIHYTQREYGVLGNQIFNESGIFVQAGDSVGLSDQTLGVLFDAAKPFIKDSPPETAAFRKVPNDVSSLYRYPWGSLIRTHANRYLHVLNGIPPPFAQPRPVSGHYNQLQDDSSLSSLYPPEALGDERAWLWREDGVLVAAGSGESLSYSHRHSMTRTRWKVEDLNPSGIKGRRVRVHLEIAASQAVKSHIEESSGVRVVGWSLTENVPQKFGPCECFALLFGAGSGLQRSLKIWIEVEVLAPKAEIQFSVSSHFYDVETSVVNKVMNAVKGHKLTEKVVAIPVVAELALFHIPLSSFPSVE